MNNLIANLRLAHKFLLVGVIAALMLVLPGTLAVTASLDQLQFARAERAGIEPAGDALRLIQLMQQHRGLTAAQLGGNEALGAPRAAKQAEVEAALARALTSAATLGDSKLTATAGRAAAVWKTLAADVAAKTIAGPQSFARHGALIADQLALLEDIANTSGIVLHPDAAGYFLQAGVLAHLPRLTEALGQVRARGALLLARGDASPEERSRVEALAAQISMHAADARKALALAAQADAGVGTALATPIERAMTAAAEAAALVTEKIVKAERLSYPSGDYFNVTTRIIDEQFKLIDTAFKVLDDQMQQGAAHARNRLIAVLGGIATLALLALWIMWTVTRTTTASLTSALRLAQAVAGGDLRADVQARGRDEVAHLLRALGTMNLSLARVVNDVRQSAESVATASAQIAQGNLDLSNRTEQQAAALEQTAATMDQLGTTVRQTADNAHQANELVVSASALAVQGGEVVGQVVATMRGINEGSRRVADIIGTIDGIAFQTNILALNAAVEAARAGEQGRGFAVVASEVRSLAQRAAAAAKEIKDLITASVERVDQGTLLVDQAGATMDQIVGAIQRVSAIVGEISHASAEQSSGVTQVGQAVSQMDQTTQQNAALVEESAAAAESLNQQAQQLVGAMAVFKLAA